MKFSLCLAVVLSLSSATIAFAGSATWSSNPINTDWSVAGNWIPETVPNCESCVATFGPSALPTVELFGSNGTFLIEKVSQVTFTAGASAYTVIAHPFGSLSFYGAGVVNQSGIQQNLKTVQEEGSLGQGQIDFQNQSSAGGNLNIFTNGGANTNSSLGAACFFNGESTAGNAIFMNEGGSQPGASGGQTRFFFSSTAGNATIINRGASAQGAEGGLVEFASTFATAGESVILNNGAENNGGIGGRVIFNNGSNAGSAQITNNGGTVSGGGGGTVSFASSSHAQTATIINNGGSVAGAGGAILSFVDLTSADESVLVANGGINGGDGGQIVISEAARSPQAQFRIYSNGSLDVSGRWFLEVKAGSLEGDGLVFLGANHLVLGLNNLSTTFAGMIMDGGIVPGAGGSVNKVGTGTLTLSGANTYTGGTTLSVGGLIISNATGSGTGTGKVTVQAGTLGGKGIIAGPTTIGTGSGPGSFLQPGKGASTATTLTIQSTLIFKSDSTYVWKLNTKKTKADQVIANGITIESGALFDLATVGNKKLTAGKVFTSISNSSATPISGTFANLDDGSTVTLGKNNFEVSYAGGDGNDLTLTVVP